MKIIKVDGCETCPYCRSHNCKGGACHAVSTLSDRMESGGWYRQIQVHDLPIPDWCPLEDMPNTEEENTTDNKCYFCGKKLDDGYLRCDDCRYAG